MLFIINSLLGSGSNQCWTLPVDVLFIKTHISLEFDISRNTTVYFKSDVRVGWIEGWSERHSTLNVSDSRFLINNLSAMCIHTLLANTCLPILQKYPCSSWWLLATCLLIVSSIFFVFPFSSPLCWCKNGSITQNDTNCSSSQLFYRVSLAREENEICWNRCPPMNSTVNFIPNSTVCVLWGNSCHLFSLSRSPLFLALCIVLDCSED